MSTHSIIRGGAIGLAAVTTPTAVMFVALGFTGSTHLSGLIPYLAVLCLALALVTGFSWACVRLAHFPLRVAVILTTLPFSLLTLATLPSLVTGNLLPLLFWVGQLAVALLVAHTAAHHAVNSNTPP